MSYSGFGKGDREAFLTALDHMRRILEQWREVGGTYEEAYLDLQAKVNYWLKEFEKDAK